jgi:glycosyltransferase involved in cell wall biosynthesis
LRDSARALTVAARMRPKFSIITPSFRQLAWLKLAAASVADQQGVSVEHIVQDAGTGPELETWAAEWRKACSGQADELVHDFQFFVEKDAGMYDAINRGLLRASGEIAAYLNCDEQYLPGALDAVAEYFDENPAVDVAFAHALVIDAQGRFLCLRKAILPGKLHTWVSGNLAILTCATFFRREAIVGRGLLFNPDRCAIGDGEWIMRLIDAGVPMGILPRITSTFLDHGSNMMLSERGVREQQELIASAPGWARALRPLSLAHYRLRKLLHGGYRHSPFDYAVYLDPAERTSFHVGKPSFRWNR